MSRPGTSAVHVIAPLPVRWRTYWRIARRHARPVDLAALGLPTSRWLVLWLAAQAWWHPRHTVGVTIGTWGAMRGGLRWGLAAWGCWWVLAGLVWIGRLRGRAGSPGGLRPILTALSRIRRIDTRWPAAASTVGMVTQARGEPLRLGQVRPSRLGVAATLVPGAAGHTADQLAKAADVIAAVVGCRSVLVRQGAHPGLATVEFCWDDPLSKSVTLRDLPSSAPGRVAFGLSEHGDPAYVYAGMSLLAVGMSGAGKSNLAWAMLHSLQQSGTPHRIRAIDPKGGMELGVLEDRAWDYADEPDQILKVLDRTVKAARARKAEKKLAGERSHTPTPSEPLDILLVDEMLSIDALLGNGKAKQWREGLRLLLAMGRAAGFVVYGFSQLGQVDALGRERDLFPQRLCLRTPSQDMTDSILGDGATRRGAAAHRIAVGTPGVGYLYVDGVAGFRRFRAARVSDEDTKRIARRYTPRVRAIPRDPAHSEVSADMSRLSPPRDMITNERASGER